MKVSKNLDKNKIIIKPISVPRKNWEKAFKKLAENGDDELLMNDVFNDENMEEWS
jgi:antitoxin MazE